MSGYGQHGVDVTWSGCGSHKNICHSLSSTGTRRRTSTSHNTHLYEDPANMSFIPSDQPLRWFVGKQDMISRKQVSVSAKSPTHSPHSGDARLSRFLGSGRMTGNPPLTRRCPFGRVTEGWPTTRESNMTSHRR